MLILGPLWQRMLFLNILIECFDRITEFDVMRVLCTELEKEEFQN